MYVFDPLNSNVNQAVFFPRSSPYLVFSAHSMCVLGFNVTRLLLFTKWNVILPIKHLSLGQALSQPKYSCRPFPRLSLSEASGLRRLA